MRARSGSDLVGKGYAMGRHCPGLIAVLVLILSVLCPRPTLPAVGLSCKVSPLSKKTAARSEDKYAYTVKTYGEVSVDVKSRILILDHSGNVERDLPVGNGDVIRIRIDDRVAATRKIRGAAWAVSGPAVLFRAEASVGQESAFAYCSPFPTLRLEFPAESDFVGQDATSVVPVDFVAGFAEIDPTTLRVHVDGVDVMAGIGGALPGGPFSGVTRIAGTQVGVENLVTDVDAGTLSFTLLALPDGPHRVTVSGSASRTRPAAPGIVSHERTIKVTRPQPLIEPLQLVFVRRTLRSDSHVEEIRDIVRRASEHGYNGMVLSASFDYILRQPPEYFTRLAAVKKICADHRFELIPILLSIGYGDILYYDRNLAEGLPVAKLPIVVKDGIGVLVRDPKISLPNGSFEKYNANRPVDIDFTDAPGVASFVDTLVSRSGKASLRFENFRETPRGMVRLMEKVTVQPFRCYQLSCWLKTEGFAPPGGFRVQIYAADGGVLASWIPNTKATQDWQEVRTGFNSLDHNLVRIYAGTWNGQRGRFWIDDFQISEVGILNVLHRPGAPITVKGESTGAVYREGEDFAPLRDEVLSFKFDHNEPVLTLLPGSNIGEGERLRIDYYQALAIHKSQVAVCMSEPKVYEIWADVVRSVQEHVEPNYFFLSGDEIRHAGWCKRCQSRGLSSAELVGDCITRQVELIRNANLDAEVLIWSDMLDPNHNAKDKYYLVNGDLAGSWTHVPDNLIIACWNYDTRAESLDHFRKLGFRTLASGCCDSGDEERATGWVESFRATPGSRGIMYTTWRDHYDLLETFGDLLHQK